MVPEIVLGAPGCGKTTALIGEVERELDSGTPPDRIGYVTFTRRAAEEAIQRSTAKFNLTPCQLPHFRTLHSLCFRALGLSSSDVFAGPRLREFADYARIRVTGKFSEDGSLEGYAPGDRCLHLEHLSRVRRTTLREQYDAAPDDLPWWEVERVALALRAFKAARGLLDFSDMLSEAARSLGCLPRLDVLICDECQDNSALQWVIVFLLASKARRIIVAGDDDQATFKWAGADVEQFVNLQGETRILGQSWRVPRIVQQMAQSVINVIPPGRRRTKRWAPRAEPGETRRALDLGEADLSGEWCDDVQPVLVLARNSYILADQVAPELRRAGIPYEWGERRAVPEEVLRAVVTWEHLRSGKDTSALEARSCLRLMTPGRGMERAHAGLPGVPDDARVTMDSLVLHHGLKTTALWRVALDRIVHEDAEFIVAARQRGERLLQRPRVRLSTIHAAKGGEARHVVLMREMARRTHAEMTAGATGEEDERRVWYVGITRARERLTVVEPRRAEACPWV